MTLIGITVLGAALSGVWDDRGLPISLPLTTTSPRPQYFRVQLPPCDTDYLRVSVKVGGKTKHYRVECAPEAYLGWRRTTVDPGYRKELIVRR